MPHTAQSHACVVLAQTAKAQGHNIDVSNKTDAECKALLAMIGKPYGNKGGKRRTHKRRSGKRRSHKKRKTHKRKSSKKRRTHRRK